MRLLKRRPRSFDIQVQDLTLRITASTDFNEESRAAALGFWEQLTAYSLRNPALRSSKRPIAVPDSAPQIVREMVQAATTAGVGPMFSFQGALTDHVGRFLARQVPELTVVCGGDYFIIAKKRMKLAVFRKLDGDTLSVVVEPSRQGVGVSTTLGLARRPGAVDGLAIVATSCMLADAAAAGVQALASKPNGFGAALGYLRRIEGVRGGVVLMGERIGVAGQLEIAA